MLCVTCFCSLGVLGLYREFYVPYTAARQTMFPHIVEVDASWIMFACSAFAVEAALLCLCLLLDKKHLRVQTGRKFFVAESVTASASKWQ
jgi:hypothetical protein